MTELAVSQPAQGIAHDGLYQRFAARAAAAPNAPVVIAGSRVVCYRELADWAEGIAGVLEGRGVAPDSVVGLALERSPELIASMLAVVRVGAAYLPIDPTHPPARRRMMLADAAVRVVVAAHRPEPDGVPDGSVVISPTMCERTGVRPPAMPPSHPQRAVYVMFTSGSTGRPKGVQVCQRNVLNFVDCRDYIALAPADRVVALANPAFDAMTFEVWAPLLNGACVVVAPSADATDPRRLGEVIRTHRATAMFLTTAYFREIANQLPEALVPLAHCLVGGEAPDAASMTRARAACPETRFVNVYGPTEATTFATWYQIRGTGPVPDPPPLGIPLQRTTTTVCDDQLRPVPAGVEGELCLGGDSVALGYLNDAALTADRFVPDPVGGGRRWYRTGDRAVLRGDGLLEFRGRRDGQVKIRGFRVEIGEIEALLSTQPDVAQYAVTVWDTDAADRRLVASVVRREPVTVADRDWTNDLRRRLLAQVPEYLVPAHVVVCQSLPLTPNGKLDRAAIHRAAVTALTAPERAPTGDAHADLIAGVWAEVLQHPVQPDENFFDAGGNSLLLLQVHDRLQQRLGRPVELIDLLEHPTVSALAAALCERAR